MRSLVTTTITALVAAFVLAAPIGAQSSTQVPLPASDSVFRRARRLVSEGDGAAGRALVDSMLRATSEGTGAYGDALFWRGALAETAADAERDYRRVIVEYSLSPYADDALLSLAELEQARGDRAAAYQHLQRFVREHPAGPARARAGLAAARLAFEQRDVTRGCAMITDARMSVGTSDDVELRNQIEYHGSRCAAAAASSATPPVPTPTVSSNAPASAPPSSRSSSSVAPRSSNAVSTPATRPAAPEPKESTSTKKVAPPLASKPEPAPREPAPHGIWTIQLAAYNTRPDAERLVSKLAARGVKARISGDAKPFRVRLDYFPTHQAAVAAVADLKQRGIIGFVTEEPRTPATARP
jgi:cell division septation protein DedD